MAAPESRDYIQNNKGALRGSPITVLLERLGHSSNEETASRADQASRTFTPHDATCSRGGEIHRK